MIIDLNFFSIEVKTWAGSVVGRLCKRNELLASRKDLTEIQKLSLLKEFSKEVIYEEVRNLESQIRAFSEGKEYSKVYKPTTEKL